MTPLVGVLLSMLAHSLAADPSEERIEAILARMSLEEKVGQVSLRGFGSSSKRDPRTLEDAVRRGRLGALLNVMDREAVATSTCGPSRPLPGPGPPRS